MRRIRQRIAPSICAIHQMSARPRRSRHFLPSGPLVALILEDGEEKKNWPSLETIYNHLIRNRFERNSTLLALGGGVVGDMTGFAAASFLRGVGFVQLPTTLLAQVDASVGGKTGINHALGKNLIGAFHQPRCVLIDVETLNTLPVRERRAGVAEVIKHAVLGDAGFFAALERDMAALLALEPTVVTRTIKRCCAIKAEVVSSDEKESGVRAILNFGHTFGHAIETLAGYGTLLHGEAVAIGMIMAADLSRRLGLCHETDFLRIHNLIQKAGLPTKAPFFPLADYLDTMTRDKKMSGGKLRFILVEKLAKVRIHTGDIPQQHLEKVLAAHTLP